MAVLSSSPVAGLRAVLRSAARAVRRTPASVPAVLAALALAVPAAPAAFAASGGPLPDPIALVRPPAAVVGAPALTWTPCPAPQTGFECGTVRVPRDHRNPLGPTMPLAVIRKPAADPAHRMGTLVLQPGGPGGSGVDFVVDNYADLPSQLRDRFDVFGFDMRGVARSGALRCWDDTRYARAVTEALGHPGDGAFDRAVGEAADFDAACQAGSGDLLPYVGTDFAARDLDLLRAALGERQLTFYGRSFGTYLGAVYADLFPDRVRAMALDGAYDPVAYADRPYSYDLPQYLALDGAFGRFLDWCADAGAACPFGGGDPRGAFDRLLGALDADPVVVPGRGTANGYTVVYRVMFTVNSGRADWPSLADALARAERRDPASFVLRPPSSASYAFLTPNVVVECADRDYPADDGYTLAAHLRTASERAPLLGPAMAYGPPTYDHNHATACTRWPAERLSRHEGDYSAAGSAPIVVLGTTGDPDTPYQDAVALSRTLDNARLVTFDAEGHTAFGRSHCAQAAVVRYLVDLIPPDDGLVCADEPDTSGQRSTFGPDTHGGAAEPGDDTRELIGTPS
ncbi:alpha/beta fold hydrolase [Yinghuangia seranimata]|uniref:alpha/beta fold hydrolase n=1 Tax=Yinghuangia seranimata TaxID=408067 RepID=UPI00248B491C|nr:alpha/beta fold hydrolase [Yinghuangia seranimata]MDI2125986.1 alpha/beta fold hydrolase [Yinghuangia seranimata]